jgi:UDP-glucose 4-epimerase
LKILITGGAGFIGSHLAERLLQEGHLVSILDKALEQPLSEGRSHQNLSLCWHDLSFVRRTWRELKHHFGDHDFIYHLAATVGVKRVLEDPTDCIRNNVESLQSALSLGIPGMFTSTSEVYGLTDNLLREDSPMQYSSAPRWSYAASKLVGEWMAKQAGWKVVRLFNVVGPRQSSDYGAVLPKFVSQALTDSPITVYGDGRQVRTFTNVRDCAEILDQLREKSFDVVNVAGHRICDMNCLAQEVKTVLQSKSEIVHVPYDQAYGPGFEECASRVPCLEKLESLLPHRPASSFKKTIRDLAEEISRKEVTSKCLNPTICPR